MFAADIAHKAKGEVDPAVVEAIAEESARLIEWLADRHDFPFEVIDNFNYPGHSSLRMHGLPSRTGRELIDRLRTAAEMNDIVILTRSVAERLMADAKGRITGVEIARPDGTQEWIGCEALILACSGFGGNADLVRRHIPEMENAIYFGHPGNRGHAVVWGSVLGAQLAHLGAYQGHGSVAMPHNILISWAVVMQGGVQVNRDGRRFSDETRGYSEQAAEVLRQPGGIAWDVFDARIAAVARQFEDFKQAERAGAILTSDTLENLAEAMQIPVAAFVADWKEVENLKLAGGQDRFGRKFVAEQLCWSSLPRSQSDRRAVSHSGRSCGRIQPVASSERTEQGFPTCSRLEVRQLASRVQRRRDICLGTGLLTATVLGHLAGKAAAGQVTSD